MECKEIRKMIPRFIQDDLENKEIKAFIEHIGQCEECREELDIQYLVSEGIQRLEKGSTFDLQNELEMKLNKASRRIRARRRVLWFMYGMEALAILAVILMTVLVILK